MKKLFSLLTLALLTMSAWAATYTHTFASGQLKQAAGTVTLSDIEWTQTAATFIGWDNYNGKGVQIGSSNNPTKSFRLSTTGIEGTITSITINSSVAKDGDATMTVSVGGQQWGNETALVLEATDYTFTGSGSGEVVIAYTATTKAYYIKSITIVTDGEPAVSKPVFSPNGGDFSVNSLEVTVSCPTENASIYLFQVMEDESEVYVNQFFPQNGAVSGSFYVTETAKYGAYAYKGTDMSETVYATFTKVTPKCAKPTFTPGNGTAFLQGEELDVTINCATEGASIMYTVNDNVYEGTAPVVVTLTESATITAVASAEGYTDSDEATASYTMVVPSTTGPVFALVSDINDLKAGDKIILVNSAEDGTAMVMGPINSNGRNFLGKNVVVNNGQVQTEDASIITLEQNGDFWNLKTSDKYIFAPGGSNYMQLESDVDEDGNANAAITVNADTTTIVFQGNGDRKIVRYNPNNGAPIFSCYNATSSVKGAIYIYKATEDVPEPPVTEVAAPVFTPEKNTVFDKNLGLEISISCETEGATIYYSTDGETFDAYNAPFTIYETTTVRAYATLGELASDTVYAKYNAAIMVYDLEEANALADKTNFYFQGDAVVTYKDGKNLWIRDEKGSGLIYGNTIQSGEFKTGDVLKKGWDAQKKNYGTTGYEKYIPEFQYPNNVQASGVTQTVEPTEYSTITTDNVNEYIVMKNQTLTNMTNADGLIFYDKFNIEGLNIEDGKAYDIVGIVTIYHDAPEVYIISATEATAAEGLRGDVNNDTFVNISDVTVLIDYLLNPATVINEANANVNLDQDINISDVTTLIDFLLSGTWPNK